MRKLLPVKVKNEEIIRVRDAIKSKGLKRTWVADRAGIHRTTLTRWLSLRGNPKPLEWGFVKQVVGGE